MSASGTWSPTPSGSWPSPGLDEHPGDRDAPGEHRPSIPSARGSSSWRSQPRRCPSEQAGTKVPGTAKRTRRCSAKMNTSALVTPFDSSGSGAPSGTCELSGGASSTKRRTGQTGRHPAPSVHIMDHSADFLSSRGRCRRACHRESRAQRGLTVRSAFPSCSPSSHHVERLWKILAGSARRRLRGLAGWCRFPAECRFRTWEGPTGEGAGTPATGG